MVPDHVTFQKMQVKGFSNEKGSIFTASLLLRQNYSTFEVLKAYIISSVFCKSIVP